LSCFVKATTGNGCPSDNQKGHENGHERKAIVVVDGEIDNFVVPVQSQQHPPFRTAFARRVAIVGKKLVQYPA
jgi:hypothetical protein